MSGNRLRKSDLQKIAESLGMSAYGWQSSMATLLGVNDRTVRRWASGESDIPDWVETKLRKAMGIDPLLGFILTPHDDWLIADGRNRREYIIHTRTPRFCARIVAVDPSEGTPLPDQGQADVTTGVVYQLGLDCVLCEITWLDAPPGAAALQKLMDEAGDFYEHGVDEIITD